MYLLDYQLDVRELNDQVCWLTRRVEEYMTDKQPGGTITRQTKFSYVPPRLALMIEDKLLEQLLALGFDEPLITFMEQSKPDLAPLEWVSGGTYGFDWEMDCGTIFSYEVTHVGTGWFAHIPFPVEPIAEPEPEIPNSAEYEDLLEGYDLFDNPIEPAVPVYLYYNKYETREELDEDKKQKQTTGTK